MRKHRINISFSFFTFQELRIKSIIRECINAVLNMQGVTIPCEINVMVTTDDQIRAINESSRNIDKATDVLSFPMFQFTPGVLPDVWDDYLDPGTGLCPLGDMAISYERAVAQADEFGHTVKREIGYLTIHSVLHLLGFDHMDEGVQKKQMRKREEIIAATIKGMQR